MADATITSGPDPESGSRGPDPSTEPFGAPSHQMDREAVLAALRTTPDGLSEEEARRRLSEHGPNELTVGKRRTPVAILFGQFANFMILVLIAAAIVSGLIGDARDAMTILALVLLNGVLGFVQEYRAERSLQALKAIAAPFATVLRDGQPVKIPAAKVVPGDIVTLEAGAIVPADLRLLAAAHLRVDEAMLTGESMPVEKTIETLQEESLSPGDRKNLAYKGTIVTYGRGTGVAVATGMGTRFGNIAAMLEQAGGVETPLQKRLTGFGRRLAIAALAICAIVLVAGLLRGESPALMFMTAISLAVAAIPEALPAVVTITLALGARKMARRRALMRKLASVETLGSVTVICSDKTGTLTMNRMRVEEFFCNGEAGRATGPGGPGEEVLRAMALNNDAAVDGAGNILGDPTEAALLTAARDLGVERSVVESLYPRVAEIPFDSERKCMTTVHADPGGGFVAFTKGAFESIVGNSVAVSTSSGPVEIRPDELARINERMAADGLRVLSFGVRKWPALPRAMTPEAVERDLTLLGFVGMMDPPRPEAREAVESCRSAGIVPVMITGDHPSTAAAIARRLDILRDGDGVLTGRELAALSPGELALRVGDVRVYARVAPEQKLDIVRALQARGEIVAMTGDGVNDAPALKQADIGVAMGITGTDVSREASAMVLLDDNFATIVGAVREGRKIYDNLRRFIRFAVTTNSAEVLTIFLAPFFGLPIPLLPIQILWINLVTDGLPSLALASEPEEKDVMRRPPRPPQEGIFAHGLGLHVVWGGILMTAVAVGVEAVSIHVGSTRWQTAVFTVIALSQLGHAMAIRSDEQSLFERGLFSNPPLIAAIVLTILLQMAAIYVPFLNRAFKTTPLTAPELALVIAASSLVFFAVEAEKWIRRSRAAAGIRRRRAD